jgi:putative nucleotidyltransferase with HDIG domain
MSAASLSSASSSTSSVRRRLHQDENGGDYGQFLSPHPKRFKTTGEDFALRELSLSDCRTNDEVHKSIKLCPVMKALVDTEVFQRLRHIQQLGTSQYVYDCANGNRFQHSLGVACLAEEMCKTIQEEQPGLGTTNKDVLCVKLAGLLHDIGHGPFSHLYEEFRTKTLPEFLNKNPDLRKYYDDCTPPLSSFEPNSWSHEESSLIMIDRALEELGLQIDTDNLDKPLKQIGDGVDANSMRVFKSSPMEDGVLTSRDFVFIKVREEYDVLEQFFCFIGDYIHSLDHFLAVAGVYLWKTS